jgi:hypothetical protein
LPSARFDFAFFDFPQFHGRHGALGLSNKIDVYDSAFMESDGPVRVVVAYQSRYKKPVWQLGVNKYLGTGVQFFDELAFNIGIGMYIVIDMALQGRACLAEILFAFISVAVSLKVVPCFSSL